MWNNYLPNPHFVESFETATGEKFNWDNYLPGYSTMKEKERVVFFLRDGLSAAEKERMTAYGADMSKYLDSGNEARIKKLTRAVIHVCKWLSLPLTHNTMVLLLE